MDKNASYHHGNLRAELLKATAELLEKEGLEAVSLRALARLVGVSHGAPARHFKNKEAIMTAYMAESFQNVVDQMLAVYDEKDDLETRFLKVADVMVNYAVKTPNTFRMMIRSEWFDTNDLEIAKPRRKIFDLLLEHMQVLQTSGYTSECSPFTNAVAAWAMIHGYATLVNEGILNEGVDEHSNLPRRMAVMKSFLYGSMRPSRL